MTSRERAIIVLRRKEPHRMPIDIGGGTSTSIVLEAYDGRKNYLGVPEETKLLIDA